MCCDGSGTRLKAAAEVKAYPELKSKKPLYGVIKFDHDYLDPKSGVEYHFVIDESGGTAPAEAPSLLGTLSRALGNSESATVETHNTYDLLYFDRDRDLDLTNGPVLKPSASPPSAAIPTWSAMQKVVFDDLSIPFDCQNPPG